MKALTDILRGTFGFPSFRRGQEAVCKAAAEGRDVLLVMPTGSGKSLCYQLPGIALGGTTLVISPLIALMEDQVAKLRAMGLRVSRIHSGRERMESRQACLDYLDGKLQFLFIAPERLSVPRFPEMLAKHKPALVAVDEAHCISHWGHDFRPDYRMLGQYVPMWRPAPVMALTATATPDVQRDIEKQLGMTKAARFIQGFRRENLAVEVVESPPEMRVDLLHGLLQDKTCLPAIIYAPSRAQTQEIAASFAHLASSACYHAGLESTTRTAVQDDFLRGKLDIMVATIAFGMGIDKPDIRTVAHVALPGSLERFYQEIGRAGRDGAPSRAILLHSYADRKTHDFFFEQDYPPVEVLDELVKYLSAVPQPKIALLRDLRFDPDLFETALARLTAYGGVVQDDGANIRVGDKRWRGEYLFQCNQKTLQLDSMIRYAQSYHCRMASLVRHFGDLADSQSPCGICDFCAPDKCRVQKFRVASAQEKAHLKLIWQTATRFGPKSTGKLHQEAFPHSQVQRREFEDLLGALALAGLVEVEQTSFEKDGRQILYSIARPLTAQGRNIDWDRMRLKV